MTTHKLYWIALAATGLGSVVLALILAFSPLGNGATTGYRDHVLNMRNHSAQEQIDHDKGNHGKGGGFLFLTVGVALAFFYFRGRKLAGMNSETEPMNELAARYGQGAMTRDEFLKRKSVLEEGNK